MESAKATNFTKYKQNRKNIITQFKKTKGRKMTDPLEVENDIQQKMITLFEKIIEKQLDYIVENTRPIVDSFPEKTQNLLKRDFRNIFISRNEYLRVCQKGGAFSLLYDCGSGSYTNWFLYNSDRRNRLFMVWVHRKNPSVLDFQKDEYLGVLHPVSSNTLTYMEEGVGEISHSREKEHIDTNRLYQFCLDQYLNNIHKIMGGFRDDVNRITQM